MDGNTPLLSTKEQIVCENLKSQRALQGKRARALLALNDGDTQVVAAKKSGLSYGQVKYLLTVFRKKGLDIFPEVKGTEVKSVKKPQQEKSKGTKKLKKKDKKKKDKKEKTKKDKKKKEKKSKKKKSKKSKK